jgi:hypothetical protein
MTESLGSEQARAGIADSSRANQTLERATALASAGRFREAIVCATDANRSRRDPRIEYCLVKWRHKAFESRPERQPAEWPSLVDDVFGDAEGPPEIAAEALTEHTLGAAVQHHGCLIVRGLISSQEAADLADGTAIVFDSLDGADAAGQPGRTSPWFAPFRLARDADANLRKQRAVVQRNGAAIWVADSPRMTFDLIDLFERRRVIDVIHRYFRERPVLSVEKATLRRMPCTAIPEWHQDGAFLGGDIRALNVWLALSDCGVDAPGLDLLPRRIRQIVETGTHGARSKWSVGPGKVAIVAEGTPVASPHFRPGDAVLFDQLLLHSTGVRPGMTKTRWAIESWFFAPSTKPPLHHAIVV